jgi:hypothetical protein
LAEWFNDSVTNRDFPATIPFLTVLKADQARTGITPRLLVPVQHLDKKTIGMYKSKRTERKYWNTGYKDAERYKKGLLQFWNNVTESRVNLHRAYLSEIGRQCQACKHEACMSG